MYFIKVEPGSIRDLEYKSWLLISIFFGNSCTFSYNNPNPFPTSNPDMLSSTNPDPQTPDPEKLWCYSS
uniref:Uncharacterized protein n=1 Tax=Meloidogyne enterolobii TaxID=390850 RepID=A0A6V7TSM2_MELEN|nr:unnamed protein product [Meloidogyne enterolobii]